MVFRGTVSLATLLVLAVLMLRGGRRRDSLRSARLYLLLAVGAVFTAIVLNQLYRVVHGHGPPFPWYSDGVALAHVPLAVAGLLYVPVGPDGPGHRLRSVADGALAGTSLWYLLLTLGIGRGPWWGGWSGGVRLGYPVGAAFLLSVGLAVVARCPQPFRRVVLWIVAGLALEGAGAIWAAMANAGVHTWGPWSFIEAGLVVLVLAAAQPPVVWVAEHDEYGGEHYDGHDGHDGHDGYDGPDAQRGQAASALWSMAPFLPLVACMVMTTRMIVSGSAMPHSELIPGLLVAVSLAGRQFAISTDRQRLVRRLMHRERTLKSALRRDQLTGLANRLGMTERMEQALQDESCWPVGVALLDLNDFKLINDNHGHQVGDAVLRELSRRLAGAVRQEDLVVRLGGDEFAVVATRINPGVRDALAERLLRCFDQPVAVAGRVFNVGASIGVVVGRPPETAGELLADADAAMYEAKGAVTGCTRLKVLNSEDRLRVSRHLRIREGIANPDLDHFHVMYQPIVDLRTGRIRGMEALSRWSHPNLGTVNPDTFIPLAEQAGTIGVIGDKVLAVAIEDLGRIKRRFPDHRMAIGINVSPRQLADPAFVGRVLGLIAQNGLAHDQVVLEITEQAFETNLDPVVETVEQLAACGVSIAVDDFGTGYSSLRYLERLQLEIMKIDRAFVSNLTASRSSHDLVVAVAAMGSALGLQIVAEGIETRDHLQMLRSTNCELGQGYLFSKPVTATEIEELLRVEHVYEVGEGGGALALAAGSGSGPAAA